MTWFLAYWEIWLALLSAVQHFQALGMVVPHLVRWCNMISWINDVGVRFIIIWKFFEFDMTPSQSSLPQNSESEWLIVNLPILQQTHMSNLKNFRMLDGKGASASQSSLLKNMIACVRSWQCRAALPSLQRSNKHEADLPVAPRSPKCAGQRWECW